MKNKLKLKKNKSPQKNFQKLITVLFYTIIIGLILSLITIKYFSQKIKPSLTKYAISETKRLTTQIINNTLTSKNLYKEEYQNILEIEKDQNNLITAINFNTPNVNKIIEKATNQIQYNIKQLEQGNIEKIDKYLISQIDYQKIKNGIVYYIPSGNITGAFLTSNIGPQIPIKFSMSGDVKTSIDSQVKEYGINNALIEVNLIVSVDMLVNMPFVSQTVTVTNQIPIIMKIIQGTIPDYYLTSNSSQK